MKNFVVALRLFALLSFGVAAFAHTQQQQDFAQCYDVAKAKALLANQACLHQRRTPRL
jgi:hypothetical protein